MDRHRKSGKVGETTEHVIAGCSSLSESAYLGRDNQLAKIRVIHQQTAKSYKLLERNIPPYCRYGLEPVLHSANMILYWERSIITDEKVHINGADKVLIDRGEKTTLVIDTAVTLTHKVLKTETEKITNYQKLALEIKNICKINNLSVHVFVISAERVVTKNLLKYLENIGLTL